MRLNHTLIFLLIILAAFTRLIPHMPNFTAVGALGVFAGVYVERKYLAYVMVLFAMIVSDIFLGFHAISFVVYGAIVFSTFLAGEYGRKNTRLRLAILTLSSSVAFFVITNFGVWLLTDMYPKSITGLSACYIAAIPFFKNQLLGDMFYMSVLAGSVYLIKNIVFFKELEM